MIGYQNYLSNCIVVRLHLCNLINTNPKDLYNLNANRLTIIEEETNYQNIK